MGETLDFALKLKPNVRQVFYVGETLRGLAEQDSGDSPSDLNLRILMISLPELLDRVARLPDHGLIQNDSTKYLYGPIHLCSLIASSSNSPVYIPVEYLSFLRCSERVVVSQQVILEQTAQLGLKVLNSGSASGFAIEQSLSNKSMADWRQLQRWRISERELPSGTIVRCRPRGLWKQYGWYLTAGGAAIVGQFGLIVFLIVEPHRRKESDLSVRGLSGRLLHASEEERKRISRELHDHISQRLALVSCELALMEGDPAASAASLRCAAHGALDSLKEVLDDIHNLSHELHSRKLEVLGLTETLRDLCRQLSKQRDIVVEFAADHIPLSLEPDLSLCFYRVAQEALNNSSKYSGSARIDMELRERVGILRMTIKDYGRGFDSSVRADGLGMGTMRERMRTVQGKLSVRTKPGEGTEVTAEVKLDLAPCEAPFPDFQETGSASNSAALDVRLRESD